ncbi:hypothetical protein HKD37_08G023001 [Glycine soja]
MQRRSTVGDLIPIVLEINATYRRRNAERIRKFLQDFEVVASFSFPIPIQSHTNLIEEVTMAEEPRRVTLEDYSSSSVPQFFTSIAQPEVAGCAIYGGAHNSGYRIPNEEPVHEVNYMGNQPRQNFNAGGYSKFQHGQPYNSQQGQWRNHPGNQFNKDQGGPSTRPQQQGLSLYYRTMKLEETPAQFMQSAIKSLEVQVGQLAKQLADRPSSSFTANTEKNPKEECKAIMTRSRMAIQADEGRAKEKVEEFKQLSTVKPTPEPLWKTKMTNRRETPMKESEIGIKMKEGQEKEKEKEEIEKEKIRKMKKKKRRLMRRKRRARVRFQE